MRKSDIKKSDITTEFEFEYNGSNVIVKTDYSKTPELNMNSVQIVYKDRPNVSAGILEKDFILNYLNN